MSKTEPLVFSHRLTTTSVFSTAPLATGGNKILWKVHLKLIKLGFKFWLFSFVFNSFSLSDYKILF